MKIFKSVTKWQVFRAALKVDTLGFVATMGALHKGHLSLIEASTRENAFTVVSVFINPQQFDDDKDFKAYPCSYTADLESLEKAGIDAVLMPDAGQIYADAYRFRVCENELSQVLCGEHREGHFDGVLTVVMRLLNLVRPDNAYFGEKDYQQLQLVRDMVAAFFMPVNVVACATVREADGLAMSSRNQRLDKRQRRTAAFLYTALKYSASASEARDVLNRKGFEVDYVEDINGRRLAATRLGTTRLIDNVPL